MIWLFLAVTAAFILGGILAVRPTGAQKKVAEIRERAMEQGLHVKLPVSLKFPEGVERGRLPFYCRHVRERSMQQSFYSAIRDGDRIQSSSGNLPTALKTKIDEMLINAHPDIGGFYIGNGLLGFSWFETESEEIFNELCSLIDQAQNMLANPVE